MSVTDAAMSAKNEPSEYGRGYTTCLRMFLFHRKRLDSDTYRTSDLLGPLLWANGASDHLYELRLPRRLTRQERETAKYLQERMLDAGHGFRREVTWAECAASLEIAGRLIWLMASRGYQVETVEECLETDRQLGLKPDRGMWGCSGDLKE